MSTYRFRLRFSIPKAGLLEKEEQRVDFTLPNGKKASFSTANAASITGGTIFDVSSGGYSSKEEATVCGEHFGEALLCFATKFRLGVDLGKDKVKGCFGKELKAEMLKQHGVRIIDDVRGISVYEEDYPAQWALFGSAELFNKREMGFLLQEVCRLMSGAKTLIPKARLAMELVTGSHFEASSRSRFLTLVLAAEALLEPEERSDDVRLFVDELRERTEASTLTRAEKDSIQGSLQWLYKDSISKSLRKMADLHLAGREYGGLRPSSFIDKCYNARSKLVHTGEVDEATFDVGSLAASLEVYLTDMLVVVTGIQ